MRAWFEPYTLHFKKPAGTSRGKLLSKKTYFLYVENDGKIGVGECALLEGLSPDPLENYEDKLQWVCDHISAPMPELLVACTDYPSIQIGIEQALQNLQYGDHLYFSSDFTDKKDSILINGLIWMGSFQDMLQQVQEKIRLGFKTIKLKIGVNWEIERCLLSWVRERYHPDALTVRVDANGAFPTNLIFSVLEELAHLYVHSIEQPIQRGNWEVLKQICAHSPVPIALDEELIGISSLNRKKQLLEYIKPQYCVLKPSLIGGFQSTNEWITLCNSMGIGWWITSALESNIGLTAIAQWTYLLKNPLPQGLGTGTLYSNNTPPHVEAVGERLWSK